MIVAHIISGPLDAIVELVLPLAIFGGLWWWSARKERRKQ